MGKEREGKIQILTIAQSPLQLFSLPSVTALLEKVQKLFRRRPKTTLASLPSHILIQIFSHLDIVDQACLALTIKPFHYILSSVLEEEAFRFPRLYQLRLERPLSVPQAQLGQIRRLLLNKLQTPHTQYCLKCQKLHRREAFAQPSYHGPMTYRNHCFVEAGIVDLCPCVSLTIVDKAIIVEALGRLREGKGVCLRGIVGKYFVPLGEEAGVGEEEVGSSDDGDGKNPSPSSESANDSSADGIPAIALIHKCRLENEFVSARLRTGLYIGFPQPNSRPSWLSSAKWKGSLVVETRYTVETDRRVMDWQPTDEFRDALYNLLWAMRGAERGSLLDINGNESGSQPRHGMLHVQRNLGSCDLPVDGNWARQDRTMSSSFVRLMHAYRD